MCWCRPEVRTDCCGRPECRPPGEAPKATAPRRDDIIDRLTELHKQAATERSHFYVGSLCTDAVKEISRLRMALRAITGDIQGAGFDVFIDLNGDYAGISAKIDADHGRTQ